VLAEKNIVLTGFMGTGKSVVGKALAARMKRRFIDTDELVARKAGMPIARIFAEKGEACFRELEKQAIADACLEKGVVIATGGGAIVNEVNAERLKASGIVICLSASPEVILRRIHGDTERPLLQGGDPLEKIRALLTARVQAYARADVTIDTSSLSIDGVVEAVRAAVEVCGRT
jgi:shikimate kinase